MLIDRNQQDAGHPEVRGTHVPDGNGGFKLVQGKCVEWHLEDDNHEVHWEHTTLRMLANEGIVKRVQEAKFEAEVERRLKVRGCEDVHKED